MTKHIANTITSCRILCSFLMLLFSSCSVPFYILYLFCGISDMTDGAVARKARSSSAFGAQFDTIADLIFFTVSFIKIIPPIHIPTWLWIWIFGIAISKTGNILLNKKLVAVHSIMNKVTGLLLFFLPLTFRFIPLKYSFAFVCAIATFSALQEGYYVGKGRKTD